MQAAACRRPLHVLTAQRVCRNKTCLTASHTTAEATRANVHQPALLLWLCNAVPVALSERVGGLCARVWCFVCLSGMLHLLQALSFSACVCSSGRLRPSMGCVLAHPAGFGSWPLYEACCTMPTHGFPGLSQQLGHPQRLLHCASAVPALDLGFFCTLGFALGAVSCLVSLSRMPLCASGLRSEAEGPSPSQSNAPQVCLGNSTSCSHLALDTRPCLIPYLSCQLQWGRGQARLLVGCTCVQRP